MISRYWNNSPFNQHLVSLHVPKILHTYVKTPHPKNCSIYFFWLRWDQSHPYMSTESCYAQCIEAITFHEVLNKLSCLRHGLNNFGPRSNQLSVPERRIRWPHMYTALGWIWSDWTHKIHVQRSEPWCVKVKSEDDPSSYGSLRCLRHILQPWFPQVMFN